MPGHYGAGGKKKPNGKKKGMKKGRRRCGVAVASENVPVNKALYSRVKAEAKRKFAVYPSAYANAWLVREYKKRGGTYRKATSGGTKKTTKARKTKK